MERPSISLRVDRALSDEAERVGFDPSLLPLVSASLLVHLAVAIAAFWGSASSNGGGAVDLETISVSIVSDRDLAAPAASGTEPTVVKPPLNTTPSVSDLSAPAETVKSEPAETAEREPTQLPDRTAQSPKESTQEASVVSETDPIEAATLPSPLPTAQAPLSIGGQTTGKAAASRGEIEQHAREVALVLARHRPKGIGAKGKIVIEFKLSADNGTLVNARVVSSSGNTRLDRISVSAVENGKYPSPPKGMSAEQLTFRIPFQFD